MLNSPAMLLYSHACANPDLNTLWHQLEKELVQHSSHPTLNYRGTRVWRVGGWEEAHGHRERVASLTTKGQGEGGCEGQGVFQND